VASFAAPRAEPALPLRSRCAAITGATVSVETVASTALRPRTPEYPNAALIFDTALAPAAAGAALAALRILRTEPGLPARVLAAACTIAAAAGVTEPSSAVVSVILGEPERAVAAAAACLARGVRVGCFRPPSVPAGTSRLRLTAHAALTGDDLARVTDVLTDVLAGSRT